MSDAAVRRLERGGRGMRDVGLGDLVRIADALGCSPLELVPGLAFWARAYRKREALVRPGEDAVERGAVVGHRPGELERRLPPAQEPPGTV